MAVHHHERTVEWGHWGITFMEPQPDLMKNYGDVVGHAIFPVGNRGPLDARPGDRAAYLQMTKAWLSGMPHDVVDGLRPIGCSTLWERSGR